MGINKSNAIVLLGALGLACSVGTETGTFGSAASVGGGNDDDSVATGPGATGGSDNGSDDSASGVADSATSTPPGDTDEPPPPGTEVCNGFDDDGDGQVDEDQPQETCGMGVCEVTVESCENGAPQACTPLPAAGAEVCNGLDDDCNGLPDDGVAQTDCSTACGAGVVTCVAGVEQPCTAPQPQAETCNLDDDNCNGSIDEGVGGCRVGVHRAYASSTGVHMYTTDLGEAGSGGFAVEHDDYFDLYAGAQPGLLAFNRCTTGGGQPLYTTSATCEGQTFVSVLGYIATGAGVAGSAPLYRLYRSSNNDHFYTTSAVERDNAITNLEYVDEGIAGYVW